MGDRRVATPAPPETSSPSSKSEIGTRRQILNWMDQYGAILILILMVAVFATFNPNFGRYSNLKLIALEAAAVGIVACGQTFVILTGGIDLSVGSMVGLSGVVAAKIMKEGFGPIPVLPSYVAILMGLVVGILAGLFHGFMITKVRMPPFIITLGTLSVYKGLALVSTKASPVHQLPEDFKWISDAEFLSVPVPVIILFLIYFISWFILSNTTLGRYTYAIGGNEAATRLAGVDVDRWKIYIYVISGFLSAVAGMILISRIDSGIFTNGEGYELTAIAGVVIGGTSLMGGIGSIWGTVAGVLIISTVNDALVLYSVPPEWKNVVTGGIIILAVLLDVLRKRARAN